MNLIIEQNKFVLPVWWFLTTPPPPLHPPPHTESVLPLINKRPFITATTEQCFCACIALFSISLLIVNVSPLPLFASFNFSAMGFLLGTTIYRKGIDHRTQTVWRIDWRHGAWAAVCFCSMQTLKPPLFFLFDKLLYTGHCFP